MGRLKEAMLLLIANERPLPPEYRDHELTGDWKGFREATSAATSCSSTSCARMGRSSSPGRGRTRICLSREVSKAFDSISKALRQAIAHQRSKRVRRKRLHVLAKVDAKAVRRHARPTNRISGS
jgi:hypothetical protein